MFKKNQTLGGRLFKHTLNFGIGSILPKVIGFFLIPIYTIYLSPKDFGIVDLATGLGAFVLVLMRLGMPGSVTRFYYDHKESSVLKDYITSIFWFLIGCSIVIGILIVFVLKISIASLIPGLPFYPFVILIVLWALLNSNTDLQRRLLQVREQSAYSAKLTSFTALLTIGLTILFVVVLKWGATGVIAATAVTAFIFFVQGQFYLNSDLKGNFQWRLLWPSFTYASGILPYHLVNNASPIITKSILSGYESLAAVGVFGIALRFALPLTVLNNALQNSFTPIYYSIRTEYKDSLQGKRQIGELVVKVWAMGLLVLALLICFGGYAIRIFTPPEFHEAILLLPFICFSTVISLASYIFGNEIYYSKKTYWVPVISLINVSVNIVSLILLIPHYGLMAVTYANILSALTAAMIQIALSRRFYQFDLPRKKFTISCLLVGALYFASNFLPIDWKPLFFLPGAGSLFLVFVLGLFYFRIIDVNYFRLGS